ncbi:MAG: hypothetical protein PHF60_00005, partial [Candidatus ainarchaeum sp.]|nr:hypothetical protein [Candidatus ainarchaeum sp.]
AGFQCYTVMLRLSAVSEERLKSLGAYLTGNKNVKFAFRTAGELGIVFTCAYRTNAELDIFLSNLEGQYGNIIRQMDVLIVNEQLKFDYFPEGLRQ